MNTLRNLSFLTVLSVVACFAQATTTQTTLSAALGAATGGASAPTTACFTSATGITAPGFNNTSALVGVMVDKEFMLINAAGSTSTCFIVTRGYAGTEVSAHASLAVVWVGPTGGLLGSPFINVPKVAGTPCTATAESHLPRVVVGSSGYQAEIGWVYNCATSGVSANLWTAIKLPLAGGSSGVDYYLASDGGANNAITASIPGLPQAVGSCVSIKLGHTLQAGANTFALNGATAVAIKSHYNVATDLGTAYAATGTWSGCYNGTAWLDSAE